MAAESPLAIYRDVLRRTREMPGQYRASAEEERGAYDTSMADIEQSYAKRDPGGPLYAMASGLLKPTRTGTFGESWGSGLSAYKAANDQDAEKEIERAQKIASLRMARAALSRRTLQDEAGLFGTQTGIAGNINTMNRQAIEDQRRAEEDAAWQRLFGGGGGAPGAAPAVPGAAPAPSPAPAPGGAPQGLGGGPGEDVLAGGDGGDIISGSEGTPQMAGGESGHPLGLTEQQLQVLRAAPREMRQGLLSKFMTEKDDLLKQAEKRKQLALQLGLKPGTHEYSQYVATGQMPQPKDATRAVSELKAIREADTDVGRYTAAEKQLTEALDLIPKAFSGFAAGARGSAGEMFGYGSDREGGVYATQRLKQILDEEAIKAMGDALTGASTDYEMRKFLELYSDSGASPQRKADALRAVIMKIRAQRRLAEARSKDMRTGEYYKPGYTVPTVENDPNGTDVFGRADAIIRGK